MELKKWNINDEVSQTIIEQNENIVELENAFKVAELDNLIVNGDFSDGLNNWEFGNQLIEYSTANNLVTFKGVGSHAASLNRTLYQIGTINSEDNYYIRAKAKSLDEQTLLFLGIGYNAISNSLDNIMNYYSVISKNTQTFSARLSISADLNKVITITDITVLNLTQIFGAGNEPSKEFCDTIMEVVGWFDGKYNLTIQEMFIIIAKWSQAQNVNSIMTLPNFDETE